MGNRLGSVVVALSVLSGVVRAEVPDGLERVAISAGIAKVKSKVAACGDTHKAASGSTIKVAVTVNAKGAVTAARLTSGDAKLGGCVVAAIKTATFDASTKGGSFSYPFVFGQASGTSDVAERPAPAPVDGVPPALDRVAIQAGIAKVRSQVIACGDKIKAGGTIKVKVIVSQSGKLTSATLESGDGKLGACVIDVLRPATFGTSVSGGSFTYPFVFGTAQPEAIDSAAIAYGLVPVQGQLYACGKTKGGSLLKVRIVVAPDGKVTSANVEKIEKGDPAVGPCVVDIIKRVVFTATASGGTVSYTVATPDKGVPAAPGTASGGEALDRGAISSGIATIKSSIVTCGSSSKARGKVKVQVTVAPGGTVSDVKVAESPDAALGDCVAAALRRATFTATRLGGSFSYPFVF